MIKKKKILLATEDIIDRPLEDIFIEVEMSRTYREFRKERYDNNFDLAQQFIDERNASRNFTVYGIIDSTVVDCDDLEIRIFGDDTLNIPFRVIRSQSLVGDGSNFPSTNVFGKKKGRFLIELEKYPRADIRIEIQEVVDGGNVISPTQSFSQKLVFLDGNENFVPYGTETVEVTTGGIITEIDNNFPFLYNIHWVKKDLNLEAAP